MYEVKNKMRNLSPTLRNKRGLLNIVGATSKFLFGTLSSEDGEHYDKIINQLKTIQDNTVQQSQTQTTLLKTLINNYNKTITDLNNNQKIIEIRLNKIEQNFENITEFIRNRNTIDQVILNCQSLITILDNLEDAILFAQLNSIHNSILTIEDLTKIINLIHKD